MNTRLKVAIIEHGRSQLYVAQRTGIHESRLSKIVNGWLEPSADEKASIARLLRQPIEDLFESTEATR